MLSFLSQSLRSSPTFVNPLAPSISRAASGVLPLETISVGSFMSLTVTSLRNVQSD